MLKNYFLIGLRHLKKNKVSTFVHVIGLALGLASSLILLTYVAVELSYDRFHNNASNIYRIQLNCYKGKELEYKSAASYYAASPAVKEQFPEVVNYVRLHRADGMVNYYDQNGNVISHFEQNGFYTDSSFFSVFSFPLIKGDRNSVLRNPNSVLVSQSTARKYFGEEDPIGKAIHLTTGWAPGEYVIDGIFKDVEANSHFYFDFLFSIDRLLVNDQFKNGGWYWENFYNYMLFKPGTDVNGLEPKISALLESNVGRLLRTSGTRQEFILQPLTDIHLYSNLPYEIATNGNYQFVYFALIIASVIMLIVWLNYVNLSTATIFDRIKEIGMQKILGARRSQVINGFVVESLLIFTFSVFVASTLLFVVNSWELLPVVRLPRLLISNTSYWIVALVILMLGMLISALYPAMAASSITPLKAIRNGSAGGDAPTLRKVFVVVQFTIAIVLIIGTFGIGRQLMFLRSQDMEIDVEHKLVIRAPRLLKDGYLNGIDAFKAKLKQHSSVRGVTSSSEVPGKEIFWSTNCKLKQNGDEDFRDLKILSVDEDFISQYGIRLLAGRNFSENNAADFGGTAIINETALQVLGLKNPESAVGQEIETNYDIKRIVGVVKDFQQESLKKNPSPIVLSFIPWHNDYLTVSLKSQDIRNDVRLVTEAYSQVFPDNAIDYFFLDDFFDRQYRSDEQFWKLFGIFSALAIFIACIGLFGLSSYVVNKRTKEVGIRKVLGISELGVIILLSRQFIGLVLLAFCISIPLATWLINSWLEGFSHRTNIPTSLYVLAGALAIAISFVTVSFHAGRAAFANPAKSIGRT